MDRLSLGEKLMAGGGLVLFVFSFFGSWVKVSGVGGVGSVSFNAWDGYGFILKLGILVGLVLAGAIIAKAAGVTLPDMPPVVWTILAGIVVVTFLLTLAIGPNDEGAEFLGVDIERGIFLFLAIIPVAAVGYGGYLKMQETEGGGATAIGGATPPPPAAPPGP